MNGNEYFQFHYYSNNFCDAEIIYTYNIILFFWVYQISRCIDKTAQSRKINKEPKPNKTTLEL